MRPSSPSTVSRFSRRSRRRRSVRRRRRSCHSSRARRPSSPPRTRARARSTTSARSSGRRSGGLLVAGASVEVVFVDRGGCSTLWSAVLVGDASVTRTERSRRGGETRTATVSARRPRRLPHARERPRMRLVVGLVAAQTIVDGALDVLIVLLALELLDVGAAGLGFLNSAAGVGGIAAALVVSGLASRGRLATRARRRNRPLGIAPRADRRLAGAGAGARPVHRRRCGRHPGRRHGRHAVPALGPARAPRPRVRRSSTASS